MKLQLLIPAYNESERIEPVLDRYGSFFAEKLGEDHRILVVLNGCRDDTAAKVASAAGRWPRIQQVEFESAIGKGGALIEGIHQTQDADLVAYVDADGATPPEALWDLVQYCDKPGVDFVVGSRWLPGAKVSKLQSKRRRLASRCFHIVVQSLFWLNIQDTQCGAKVFRKEVLEKIKKELLITDMAFDVNLLYAAKRAGFKLHEVPTTWTDQSGSKVRLFRTSMRMLLSVIRLRMVYSPLNPLRKLLEKFGVEYWLWGKVR